MKISYRATAEDDSGGKNHYLPIPERKKILAFFLDIAFCYFYTFGNCNIRVADSM